jgi:hypothetical protein
VEECEEQLVKVEVERLERNSNVLWFEEDVTKQSKEYLEGKGKKKMRIMFIF